VRVSRPYTRFVQAAAFFDLDRTLLRRSSALALAGAFREHGVIGRGQLANFLRTFSQAIAAFATDLGKRMDDVLVLTIAAVLGQGMGVAKCGERSELVEVPDEVLAPVADTHDGDVD